MTLHNYLLLGELNQHTVKKQGQLDEYTTAKKGELDSHTAQKKNELNTHEKAKEKELDNYVTTVNKPELDKYINIKKEELNSHTKTKESEITQATETKKQEITAHGASELGKFGQGAKQEADKQIGRVVAEGDVQVQRVKDESTGVIPRIEKLESGKVSKSGDTVHGSLTFDAGACVFFKNENGSKNEFGYNKLYKHLYIHNPVSKGQLTMFDNGNTRITAENLTTQSKEVVESVNELNSKKSDLTGATFTGLVAVKKDTNGEAMVALNSKHGNGDIYSGGSAKGVGFRNRTSGKGLFLGDDGSVKLEASNLEGDIKNVVESINKKAIGQVRTNDLNNISFSGLYYYNDIVNIPETRYGYVIHTKYDGDKGSWQLACDDKSGEIYSRHIESATQNNYTEWKKIWHSKNFNPSTKLDKSSVVNDLVSGGTDKPLSAEQGKVLKSLLDSVSGDSSGGLVKDSKSYSKILHTGDLTANGKDITVGKKLYFPALFLDGVRIDESEFDVNHAGGVITLKQPYANYQVTWVIVDMLPNHVKFAYPTLNMLKADEGIKKLINLGDVIEILGESDADDGGHRLVKCENSSKLNGVDIGSGRFLNEIPNTRMDSKQDKVDSRLQTHNKAIVDAINEQKSYFGENYETFPQDSFILNKIYYHKETNKLFRCNKTMNQRLTVPDSMFTPINIYENYKNRYIIKEKLGCRLDTDKNAIKIKLKTGFAHYFEMYVSSNWAYQNIFSFRHILCTYVTKTPSNTIGIFSYVVNSTTDNFITGEYGAPQKTAYLKAHSDSTGDYIYIIVPTALTSTYVFDIRFSEFDHDDGIESYELINIKDDIRDEKQLMF